MAQTAPGQAPFEIEDRPAPEGSRGWSGLERSRDETIAFAGSVGVLGVAGLALLVGGLPGLLLVFVLATLAIMGLIVVISMGN